MNRWGLALLALALGACSGRPPPRGLGDSTIGGASWYGIEERGRTTANGESMDPDAMTAAHKTLPFGTMVKVTDLATGRSVEVRINDRGPFVTGRIIDLSHRAARELGILQKGVAQVMLTLPAGVREIAWSVQVGAFGNAALARELWERLRADGYRSAAIDSDGELHRVRVGLFPSRRDAERLRDGMRSRGFEAIVVEVES